MGNRNPRESDEWSDGNRMHKADGDALRSVLEVRDLQTHLYTPLARLRAVNGVSFSLKAGELLAIVGESGSGKSMMALSLLRLLPAAARVVSGSVRIGGREVLKLTPRELREIRGKEISMIFQEPMTALNPVEPIGRQISEALLLHQKISRKAAMEKSIEMLRLMRIAGAEERATQYPHQLSGGMRQRVMIAIALACNPKVLIADEPTTALDVTVQAQILALIGDLRRRFGTSVLLITHDLGVVAQTADRVIVMYTGRKVEEGTVKSLFSKPLHPYTCGLIGSIPKPRRPEADENAVPGRLSEIAGAVPPLTDLPHGCHFAPRCPLADARCRNEYPPYEEKKPGHWVACWRAGQYACGTS